MELIILGSGTYQPELKRHASSYLLKTGKQNLSFDFGRGAIDQLMKLGLYYYDIDEIFISHTHADHCSELGSFLHIALAEPAKGRFRKKDLTIYGPKGIKETVNHLLRAFNLEKCKPSYKFKIKELNNNSIVKGKDWTLKSYSVNHSKVLNCLSYRLMTSNKIFTYSGDTADCLGLRQSVKNADLAVIETSWPNKVKPKTHLSGGIVGRIAQKAKIKKLVLTHIAPYYLENFDVKKEVSKFYKGSIIIAKDLMKIKI